MISSHSLNVERRSETLLNRRMAHIELPQLWVPIFGAYPFSQNGKSPKINPKKVACFSRAKERRFLTIFHQHSTTN